MNDSFLLSKKKIDCLYNTIVDLPDYVPSMGNKCSGKGTRVGDELDHVVNSATPTALMFGVDHLDEQYQSPEGQIEANQLLFRKLNSLQHCLFAIHGNRSDNLPLVSDVEQIFAQAYGVFNPKNSYGRYAQALLQKAAIALELPDLLEVRRKQGLSK